MSSESDILIACAGSSAGYWPGPDRGTCRNMTTYGPGLRSSLAHDSPGPHYTATFKKPTCCVCFSLHRVVGVQESCYQAQTQTGSLSLADWLHWISDSKETAGTVSGYSTSVTGCQEVTGRTLIICFPLLLCFLRCWWPRSRTVSVTLTAARTLDSLGLQWPPLQQLSSVLLQAAVIASKLQPRRDCVFCVLYSSHYLSSLPFSRSVTVQRVIMSELWVSSHRHWSPMTGHSLPVPGPAQCQSSGSPGLPDTGVQLYSGDITCTRTRSSQRYHCPTNSAITASPGHSEPS